MRWPLIAKRDGAAGIALALGLAAHQHLDPAGEDGNLGILPRDRIGQIVDGAQEVGDLLFEMLHPALVARGVRRVKRCAGGAVSM